MKKIRKVVLLTIFFIGMLLLTNKVNATSISASPSNPKKGQSVTITVTVPNVNTVDLTATVSGAGTSGTIRLVDGSITGSAKTFSKSITVTPTSAGTITVKVSNSSNAVLNGEYVGVSASKNITVIEPTSSSGGSSNNTKPSSGGTSTGGTTSGNNSSRNNSYKKPTTTTTQEVKKSTDSTLSALSVKEGTISPEFKKDIKEYALTIPYETSEINVTATPTDSKATATVKGNKELKEGENTVTITVTAEDGSSSNYTIKVNRKRVPIALKSLNIRYENENGELIELPLNPEFTFDKIEYTIEDLEYWVEKLNIEAVANIEGANIDIQGAENIQSGENTITIAVEVEAEDQKDLKEGEEPKKETITYTIKVNKKEKPTLIAKIKNWFKGIFGTVSTWYNQNTKNIVVGGLGISIVALIGLSIYIVIDYNKYKDAIYKIKKAKEINSLEVEQDNINKEITTDLNNNENINKNDKQKGGKHF